MRKESDFEAYLNHLCLGVGHARRHESLRHYCKGLTLPLERKSVEPIAAAVDPTAVRARHQSLHHFVADAPWSDERVLAQVNSAVLPSLLAADTSQVWIVDDTGMPKKGQHSVGVSRQYCGQLGKTENCQVVVSLSVANANGSLPLAHRLYLPQSWTADAARCESAGVPGDIRFQTKPEIALAQITHACETQSHRGTVLADAAYGNDNAFRDGLDELGLSYLVAIQPTSRLWPPGVKPLPPKPRPTTGRPPTRQRYAPGHKPISARDYIESLGRGALRTVTWRQGSNQALKSRFVAKRVRVAHRDYNRSAQRDPCWLLAEWPVGDPAPTKFWVGNLPESTSLKALVNTAKKRWRIERDYQDLKQEFGFNHYEGRGWRGLHHHMTLCVAAYGFVMRQRLTQPQKKKATRRPKPALPDNYIPRGSPKSSTTCS